MNKAKRSMSASLSFSLIMLLSLSSGGCAIGTTRLELSHDQLEPVVQKRAGDVLVRPFVDKRENTQFIGNKRNGFGMVMGHVATREGVKLDEVMTQYFIEALRNAGYNAVLDKSASGVSPQLKCDAIIDGEIIEFWMDLYMAVWHKVGVKVKAINPSDQKVVWERLIQGEEKRVLWVGATGEFERIVKEAITIALNRAAKEFASDDYYNKTIMKQP